jgi:hypothetical protein
VLVIEFSYNVGNPGLMALDRSDEGVIDGGAAGWKKLVGGADDIGRLKFCTGREGE